MSDLFAGKAEARLGDHAHARRSDPVTSHQAADAASAEIETARAKVEAYARQRGAKGFTDAQMSHEMGDDGSTLRSRRAELADAGLILDSGRTDRFQDSERERIVWVHRDFVPNAPPLADAGRASSRARSALKAEGKAMATELDQFALSMRREGRGMFGNRLAEIAEVLRQLS